MNIYRSRYIFCVFFLSSCSLLLPQAIVPCEEGTPAQCDGQVLVLCQNGIEFRQDCGNLECNVTTESCEENLCGNETLDPGEECDDGNQVDADGCEADCTLPVCGNNIVDPGEICLLPHETFAVGNFPVSVAIGDFDNDSIPDIVAANASGSSVSVLLGIGSGVFAPAQEFAVGVAPNTVRVADLDEDGFDDIIVSNNNDNIGIRLSLGNGLFDEQIELPAGELPSAVAIGNINNNGFLDIVGTNFSSDNISVFLGAGNANFAAQQNFVTGLQPTSIELEDFNNDGFLDVITGGGNAGALDELNVLLGNGNGTFGATQTFPVSGVPFFLAIADLNNDGFLDVLSGNEGENNVGLLLGNGDGTLQSEQTFFTGDESTRGVALGDIDNDGILDIVSSSLSSEVSILLGTGDTNFILEDVLLVEGAPEEVILGDLNQDGVLDMVTSNQATNNVSVILSNP